MEAIDYHAIVGALVASFLAEFGGFLAFAVALILCDLRFGIMASKKRGEEIRGSRMRRRTMNKIFDYSCWLFLAYTCRHSVGVVFGVPVVSVALVLYVYFNELASVVNNYADYKGLKKRIDIWKLITGRHDLERCLEDKNKLETDESE